MHFPISFFPDNFTVTFTEILFFQQFLNFGKELYYGDILGNILYWTILEKIQTGRLRTWKFPLVGWPSNQIFKKGQAWQDLNFYRGLLGKKGWLFSGRGCNFDIKNKLKSEIFNDKKSLAISENISELELRICGDSWIMNQFLDPTNQKIGKLSFFSKCFFQNMMFL